MREDWGRREVSRGHREADGAHDDGALVEAKLRVAVDEGEDAQLWKKREAGGGYAAATRRLAYAVGTRWSRLACSSMSEVMKSPRMAVVTRWLRGGYAVATPRLQQYERGHEESEDDRIPRMHAAHGVVERAVGAAQREVRREEGDARADEDSLMGSYKLGWLGGLGGLGWLGGLGVQKRETQVPTKTV